MKTVSNIVGVCDNLTFYLIKIIAFYVNKHIAKYLVISKLLTCNSDWSCRHENLKPDLFPRAVSLSVWDFTSNELDHRN